MSATAKKQAFVTVSQGADWQLDRAKRSALHVSGLVVSWQVVGKGDARQPALDIGGMSKVTSSPWAGQINERVEQAIALLDA